MTKKTEPLRPLPYWKMHTRTGLWWVQNYCPQCSRTLTKGILKGEKGRPQAENFRCAKHGDMGPYLVIELDPNQ